MHRPALLPASVLITATALSLVVVAILPMNEASAKVCENNNNNNDVTCTHQQDSNNHDHSTPKDTTPFLLPVPFP